MKIFVKSARVIDPESNWHQKTVDIRIHDGIITEVAEKLDYNESERLITANDLYVSQGWFDLRADFADPGFEHRETIESGCNAAAYGGFTSVAVLPTTLPVADNKSVVDYIRQKSRDTIVDIFPIGALSQNLEGKDLSEMYDMKEHGAVAFYDDKKTVNNTNLLSRALLYSKTIQAPIFSFAEDKHLSSGASVHEGPVSTSLGLKGIPVLAETISIQRDLELAKYNNTSIHFTGVSSKEGVELIRNAKKNGQAVSADVAAYQLYFSDESLLDFDSNYKVKPILRSKEDVTALLAGLADGTIDIVCSDHKPQDIESKNVEFDYADYGMSSLESAFGSLSHAARKILTTERIIDSITTQPRKLLKLTTHPIKEGYPANLTLFQPAISWIFEDKHIHSKGKNTPFVNKELTGKALAVINKGRIVFCD